MKINWSAEKSFVDDGEWVPKIEAEQRITKLEADRDDARRVMKEACEANRVFVARLDAVKKLCENTWDEDDHWVSTYAIMDILEPKEAALEQKDVTD